jgi:head-tail adaptor
MQAGKLRHTITITSEAVASQNSYGEDVLTTSTVGEYPCRVEYLEGRELAAASQRWARARYRITMRYQPGVTISPNMTVTWEGRTLDIVDVRNPGDSLRPETLLIAQDHEG